MATYLLTWNPKRWPSYFTDELDSLDERGFCEGSWSVGVTKRIVPGDRIFLMKVGQFGRGLVASGWAISNVYPGNHWEDDTDPDATHRSALYVDVRWDTVLDPYGDILPHQELKDRVSSEMKWTPQNSGVSIRNDIAAQLEHTWARFSGTAATDDFTVPDEVDESSSYRVGSIKRITVNAYERKRKFRTTCINHYGPHCSVCGFNFEEMYGAIGAGYIHVHHLTPLSEIGEEYDLHPIRDLRPVCPNCHAMIHQSSPARSIEELRSMLKLMRQ